MFMAPLPSWQHRDSLTPCCTVHSGTVLYPSVVIGGFGDVPLRENFSGIFVLPRAGVHQFVHGPGSKYS